MYSLALAVLAAREEISQGSALGSTGRQHQTAMQMLLWAHRIAIREDASPDIVFPTRAFGGISCRVGLHGDGPTAVPY